MQVAAIFDNFGQTPMAITSGPHKARKTIPRVTSLLTSPGKIKVVSTAIVQGPRLQAAQFTAGKNHLFTLTEEGGLLKHTLKMSNLELQVDTRMKQGLYPHVGDVKESTRVALSPEGTEMYMASLGGGIQCLNTSSGTEKWSMLGAVGIAEGGISDVNS